MEFSEALTECMAGRRITRTAWNSANYVTFQRGYPDGIEINENTAKATGLPEGTRCVFAPYLLGFNRGVFMPWRPNRDDLRAVDWEVSLELRVPQG